MQSVEVTAKTLQDATKAAADKLGVTPDSVKVSVLEETKGLFGKSTVRVRAELVEAAPEAPEPAPKKARAAKGPSKAMKAIDEAMNEPPPAPVAKAAAKATKAAVKTEPAAEPDQDAVEATQQDADRLTELVREVTSTAGLQITAHSTSISGRYVSVQLDGKDVAHLVGKHGEVLNALQYLINIMAGRRFGNGVRVTLDGNDFRKRREDQLTQLAQNIADQVRKRQEEAVLDALPAFERRIVHKALSDLGGITTYSEGEEPNRRVVIAPAEV